MEGKSRYKDVFELLSQMINVKIRYPESQIDMDSNEEDIKPLESKIIKLQNELFELRPTTDSKSENLIIEGIIKNSFV
ncbi:MAG: hypothetical protein ACOYKR_03165 [Sphingobacterium thalpophilum]